MILYFSGTENSKYLAEKLGQLLEDDIVDLFSYIKEDRVGDFHSTKAFVLVAPTYSWRLPRFLEDFLLKCKFSGSADIYVLMNYGDSFGNARSYLKKDFDKLGLNFKGLYGIKMPENYLLLFNLDSDETNKKIVDQANFELEKLASIIKSGDNFPKTKVSLAGRLQSSLVNSVFYKFIVKDKKFYATDKCIECGLCSKFCVLNNISCENGRPKWLGTCTHCCACISKCPTGAIEYGEKTIGKDRYLLSKLFKN